jgi:hypothetical protein
LVLFTLDLFLKLDKSGMTYVIFKGTKTASEKRVNLSRVNPEMTTHT